MNTEIRATLESTQQRQRFALMNNGVTIIASTLRATGNRFHLEGYQIVNGCQTSHVLFDQRANLDDTVLIPLRIIATKDEELIAAIVKATNRQTAVKEEQLLALNDFQKKLEAFFASFEEGRQLFYERRSRQYNTVPGIEKTRVVTLPNLIRAYASTDSEGATSDNSQFSCALGLRGHHNLRVRPSLGAILLGSVGAVSTGVPVSQRRGRCEAQGCSLPYPDGHSVARFSVQDAKIEFERDGSVLRRTSLKCCGTPPRRPR